MPWYEVTFIGLRKKPFSTGIEAANPHAARAGILSIWHVRKFISTKELKPELMPLQQAVKDFLRSPRSRGAVAALRNAFEKEIR